MSTKKTFPRAFDSGFSLVELLLVMTLAPIVFFSVYSNFSAGVRIWSTVVRQTPEEDINIFCYKARRDLENMLRYASIPFSGDKEEIVFTAAIEARSELGGKRGIGQVRYFYDSASKTIIRNVKDFSESYKDSSGREVVLLRGVSSFEVSYLSFSEAGRDYQWSEFWKPEENSLPVAVRLSLLMEQSPDKQERVIFIPVGGNLK